MDLQKQEVGELLLYRAVAAGRESGLFHGSFIEELRNEGAKMTVNLAHRFYNKYFEANLRQARDIVIGACNLGLILECGNDRDEAMRAIRKHHLLRFFRRAYSALENLVNSSRISQEISIGILECLIEVSHEPGQEWRAHDWFLEKNLEVRQKREDADIKKRILSLADSRDDDRNFDTVLWSIYAALKPCSSLDAQGLLTLAARIDDARDPASRMLEALSQLGLAEHPAKERLLSYFLGCFRRVEGARDRHNTLLRSLNIRNDDVDKLHRIQEDILAKMGKTELLEELAIMAISEQEGYDIQIADRLLDFPLAVDEISEVLSIFSSDTRLLARQLPRIASKLNEKRLVELSRLVNDQGIVDMLIVTFAEYCKKKSGKKKQVGEDLAEILATVKAEIIYKLRDFLVCNIEIAAQRRKDNVPFLLGKKGIIEFFSLGGGEEFRIFDIYFDVTASCSDDERLGYFKHLIDVLKQDAQKQNEEADDEIFYSSFIREAIKRSRAEAFIMEHYRP